MRNKSKFNECHSGCTLHTVHCSLCVLSLLLHSQVNWPEDTGQWQWKKKMEKGQIKT